MKRIVKVLLFLIGICLLFLFAAPIIANIFNIGNVLGILIALFFILLSVFLDNIISIVKMLRANRTTRIYFNAFSAAALTIILCFTAAMGSVIASSSTNAEDEETVIVLGCAVEGNSPSLMLSSRVNAACRYLKNNPGAVAVLSGGKGEDENISEAQCMYDLLVQMGIEKERLYIEDQSTNTKENIEYSLEVIRDNGLSENIAIATSDFHLKRATMIAQKYGISDAKRISASSGFFSVPTFVLRDTLGVIKEFVTG